MTADRLAPALWDLQVNGRWGISFADPGLTAEQAADVLDMIATINGGWPPVPETHP